MEPRRPTQSVSVVIPVYRGEATLDEVVQEVLSVPGVTPAGHLFEIAEVVLVHDGAVDRSDEVMRRLEREHPQVEAIWLSRNFGQHAATLAGISRSSGAWVVTLDEDGQFDPRSIGAMIDTALATDAQIVYARPTNPAPHGWRRNAASNLTKALFKTLSESSAAPNFHSFRLMLGDLARAISARVGPGVYLDVALSWVAGTYATVPVVLRGEVRHSAYTPRKLIAHFRRMVVSTGTRSLRAVSVLGVLTALGGVVVAAVLIAQKITAGIDAPGWTSLMVVLLLSVGAVLLSLGIIAEYIGVTVGAAMGRPAYLMLPDRAVQASELPSLNSKTLQRQEWSPDSERDRTA